MNIVILKKKKSFETKFMYKNKLFQSSGKKNELHIKFRDENNSLTKKKKKRIGFGLS